jgi:uncharacterized protein (TIGR03067 family)
MFRRYLALVLSALACLGLENDGTGEPVRPEEPGRIERLVRELGSEKFREREAAFAELKGIGEPALLALRAAMENDDAEIRCRAQELVEILRDRDRALDRAALQGRWVLKTTEWLGQKADQDPTDEEHEKYRSTLGWRSSPGRLAEEREMPEDFTKYRTTMEFKGRTFEHRQWAWRFRGGGGVNSTQGTYSLDVHRNPKVLEEVWKDPVTEEFHVDRYVYEVRGDTLQVCLTFNADPRHLPTKFVADADEDVLLLTWKRQQR